MTLIRQHHEAAMKLAALADEAKARGLHADSIKLFKESLEQETIALENTPLDMQPTRAILIRSCASLAYDAGELRQAEKLATQGISEDGPEAIAEELKNIYETINFGRHLSLNGIELSDSEFQLSLAGPAVAYGTVPADELNPRIETINKMLLRLSEKRAMLPFREVGPPTKKAAQKVSVYVSVARAASYALTIRLGKPLDQEEMFDSSADIMAEYLTLMEHYTEGRNSEIENVLDDKAYYRNFVSQARKLVPDGKRISTVGFTSMRAGQVRKLALKKQPPIDWKSQDESTSTKRVVVKGMLSAASSIDKNFIVIVDENNPQQYVIQVPKGMMSDIVKPLWESRVSVEADQNGNNYELVGIEPADTE